jgi:alpha-D-xyloside xylohydrolase
MPYIVAQARLAAERGHPMMRPLFFDHPSDPASWLVEDEYLFGTDLLVAPLLTDTASARRVYLPPGAWTDYQSGRTYEGARWHEIAAGEIPIVLLVRDHAVIPHVAVAQHTGAIDWTRLELRAFSSDGAPAEGSVAVREGGVHPVRVEGGRLLRDPLAGRVTWRVTSAASR